MFKKVLAATLRFLGISEFDKNAEGKSQLTAEQKLKLENAYGQVFVAQFEKDLEEFEADSTEEDTKDVDALTMQMAKMDADFQIFKKAAEAKEKQLQEKIKKLEGSDLKVAEATIDTEGSDGGKKEGGQKVAFKANMNYRHNQVLQDYLNGKVAQYSGDDTVDSSQLRQEFGAYISNDKLEVMLRLTQQTESVNCMTTIITDKSEWRATQAIIDSVVQQFTPYWTPSGKAKFTPIKIENRKHKINVPIKPSDVMDSVVGYYYDENLTPSQMPIVKYIIDVLILPKIAEDRELKMLATGEYEEAEVTADGQAATPAEKSMDGYVTILKKLYADPVKKAKVGKWLLEGITLTDENIVDEFNKIYEQLSPLYQSKVMTVHIDPNLLRKYQLAYQKKFPLTKNQDGAKMELDFTPFVFAPMPGMRGTGCFFLTPKENFKHLLSRNPNDSKLYMQELNYDVKIFGEFKEAVGFAIAEAIFAYLPPVEAPEGGEGGV
jgi:hypothetical protein